ncbi:MAG TPA: hypothetical protein ENH89_23335 [Aurantimonas coralicida]|nr:hypothetical protein [Aurantimonas coralicida]
MDDGGGPVTIPGADTLDIDTSTIQVVVPAGLVRDRFIEVEVENTEDSTTAISYLYSQLTLTELETDRLPGKKPGFREATITTAGVPDEDELVIEAKDFDRLSAKVESLQYDNLTTLGDLAPRGPAQGLRRIPIGTDGQRWFRDENLGGQWKTLEPDVVWWAGQVPAATVTELFLATQVLGSFDLSGPSRTEQIAPKTGQLALLQVHVTDDSAGATSRISRVRILVEGVEVFDSLSLPVGQDPFIPENGHWTLAPFINVTEKDVIEIAVTKNNANVTLNVIARAVLV